MLQCNSYFGNRNAGCSVALSHKSRERNERHWKQTVSILPSEKIYVVPEASVRATGKSLKLSKMKLSSR